MMSIAMIMRKEMMRMSGYKSREYCRNVDCVYQIAYDNGEIQKEALKEKHCSHCGAYQFHKWLQNNDYKIVKSVFNWGKSKDDEMKNNAQLMAAAPELLEAAKMAEEKIAGFEKQFEEQFKKEFNDPILNALRKAIAKAERGDEDEL